MGPGANEPDHTVDAKDAADSKQKRTTSDNLLILTTP